MADYYFVVVIADFVAAIVSAMICFYFELDWDELNFARGSTGSVDVLIPIEEVKYHGRLDDERIHEIDISSFLSGF